MDFTSHIACLSAEQAALLEALLQEETHEGTAHTEVPRVVPIQKSAVQKPLFIIHGTGGKTLFLHGLARHMSPAQPVHGIEAATRVTRRGYSPYVEALRAAQPHGPYWLGGYSAGCLIAFEVAAQLRQAGQDVAFLLLIDPVALPAAPETARPTPRQRLQRRFEIAMLAGVTPLNPDFCTVQQANRGIAALAQNFQPVPIDQRIHVIHGTRGAYVPSQAVLRSWAALAGGGLETSAIEADHFEIVREPHAALTAVQIQSWLDALQR